MPAVPPADLILAADTAASTDSFERQFFLNPNECFVDTGITDASY